MADAAKFHSPKKNRWGEPHLTFWRTGSQSKIASRKKPDKRVISRIYSNNHCLRVQGRIHGFFALKKSKL
jgi:hypothetical protein